MHIDETRLKSMLFSPYPVMGRIRLSYWDWRDLKLTGYEITPADNKNNVWELDGLVAYLWRPGAKIAKLGVHRMPTQDNCWPIICDPMWCSGVALLEGWDGSQHTVRLQ